MICPECGGVTHVFDSRPSDYYVRRRRACEGCGRRFSTIEVDLNEYKALKGLDVPSKIAEMIKQAMNQL